MRAPPPTLGSSQTGLSEKSRLLLRPRYTVPDLKKKAPCLPAIPSRRPSSHHARLKPVPPLLCCCAHAIPYLISKRKHHVCQRFQASGLYHITRDWNPCFPACHSR